MKLQLAKASGQNTFSGYGEGYVLVDGVRHERPLVVTPDRLVLDWPASRFETLASGDFEPIVALGREIVLLGTGPRLRFPRAEVLRPLIEAGVGVEVMSTPAACRTYNILVAEDRKVAAALLFE